MIRGLNNWIRFGDEEELTLTHGMSMQGGQVVCDWYDVEGGGRRIRYLPEELAELHEAIHEMLRMAEQHRDALTDGAEQQIPGGEPLLETVCGDPFVDPRLRTVLANEVESEPVPDEAPVLNRAEKEVLRALAHGDALWLKNDRAGLYGAVASVKEESIKSLWDKRLIGPGDEPANMVDGMEDGLLWYCITDAGLRALAAQTPEAESEKPLSGTALDILRGMAGGRRLLDAIESAFVTYETSGTSFSREPFGELRKRGLVCVAQDAGDGFCYYAISAEGVGFLADQEPS